MNKQPMYILTYEHGGYVLWGDHLKPRLKNIAVWLEKYPKLKIGLDYESFTFDEFTRCDPEIVELVANLLKKYPDRVGLGATTYGQPLALTISEESNARQLLYAVRTNLDYFGITPNVYSISEFALHNQTPQLIKQCGYDAAILRSHVMGYGYPKNFDSAWGLWKGKDDTQVPAVPTYPEQGRGYNCTTLDNWILSRWSEGEAGYDLEDFEEKFKKYQPLLASRYDDVCQPIEKLTEYIETKDNYEYVLLEDIPKIYGEAKDVLNTTDNDFHVQMPWGYCGNEIFNGVRKSETECVQAEKLNTISVMLGGESQQKELEEAWKFALAAQHHDVTICGLLDLSRRFIPTSLEYSCKVKTDSLNTIAARFADKDSESLVVINAHSFDIDEWIEIETDEALSVADSEATLESDYSNGVLRVHIKLPAMSIKRFTLKEAVADKNSGFEWNEEAGILTTPRYSVKLTESGIAYIDDKTLASRVYDNGNGELFTAWIDGEDRVSSGKWEIEILNHSAKAVQNGYIGTVPYRFEMQFNGEAQRIDCKAKFEIHGEHIGRTDVTQGRPVPLTLNGHHHEDKLCFAMNLCLEKDRKVVRDLPYAISEWNEMLRKTEPYWYPNDLILIDTEVDREEAFNSTSYTFGTYWVGMRDSRQGLAVMNRGCMGCAIQGNRLLIPLIYANDYMCGTKMLDGTFESEFALFTFDSSVMDTDIHRVAMSYNMMPSAIKAKKGNGDMAEYKIADIKADGETILTALYPENGAILARFCNFSENEANAVLSSEYGKAAAQVDLLGNEMKAIENGKLSFGKWEIKTVKIDKN